MAIRFHQSTLSYFRSGWAFLLPYLAAYLLYAGLKLPVHSSPAHAAPALVSVFWVLHAAHLLGGAAVLWVHALAQGGTKRYIGIVGWQGISWLLLALLFWIPGAYLELPADPWTHFVRTTEWDSVTPVTAHSTWQKFSYFLSYSLVAGGAPPLTTILARLDLFYTGCCLLLCWQYYLLGRAAGLGPRAASVFVFIQSLVFGNNIFSFYRYYGISSSLFGQLAAVTLVRIALELFRPTEKVEPWPRRLVRNSGTILALPVLIAFNHPQGIGIAALGLVAVVAWRLVAWRKGLIGWLALAAIVASGATVLWYPRQPILDEIYRHHGWLNAWYGFDLFTPGSEASNRAMVILGWFGLVNLLAGAVLVWRNHVAGWLTVTPILFLSLPLFSIPLANALSRHNDDAANIITYHRMLFAIPSGLALVVLGSLFFQRKQPAPPGNAASRPRFGDRPALAGYALLLSLLFLILAPSQAPSFNRLYHALYRTPSDLNITRSAEIIEAVTPELGPWQSRTASLAIAESVYAGRVRDPVSGAVGNFRFISYIAPARPLTEILIFLRHTPHAVFVPQSGRELYTHRSLPGYLSGHWLPQIAAIGLMGGPEFEQNATSLGYQKIPMEGPSAYLHKSAQPGPR